MNATELHRPNLAAAVRSVAAAREDWERYQCEPATAEDIAEAEDREAELRAELASLTDGLKTLPTRARLAALRLIRATQLFLGLHEKQAWATGYLLGVPAVAVILPLVLLIRPSGIAGAAIILGTYFTAVFVVSALLLTASRAGVDATIDRIRRERAESKARAADVVAQLAAVRERIEFLRGAHAAHVAYEQAVSDQGRLETLLASERFQLGSSDWRSLRGGAFEEFVGRVFRMLGYEVRATKATGNQGVNLIVRGYGRSIAVQTAGTAESVGNAAVQQVFAGRVYHKCDECCVVTNSTFTSGAIDLATEVTCRLLDANRIPALIAGEVY